MLWKQVQDPVARSFEKSFKQTARGEFLEELKTLLTALRKATKAVPDWVAVGLTIKEVLESREGDWRVGFIPLFQGLFEEWADQWSIELGVDFALSKPLVQAFIETHTFQFVDKHQGVTRKAVANLVSVATAEGYSVKEFRDQLTSVYGQWSELRAEMIARTETIRAENAGALAAYQSAGVRLVQWWTALDDRVCPFCGKLHGKKFKTGEPLFVVGDVFNVDGQNLKLNYDDVRYPPLHVFCRCTLLPVIVDISDQVEVPDAQKVPDAQRARDNLVNIKTQTGNRISEIDAELDLITDREFELFDKQDELISEGKDKEASKLDDELDDLTKKQRALTDEKYKLREDELTKIREVIYVENPTTPKYSIGFSGTITKDQKARWKFGAEEFSKLVEVPTLNDRRIHVNRTDSGRSYAQKRGIVYMSDNAGARTVIHELAHVLELNDSTVNKKALEFYKRRTKGEKLQKLSILTGDSGYDDEEKAKPDKFIHPYMGKIYGDGEATEIVSMGLEEMWVDPVGFAEKDPDYFDFIYNLVRGI